MSRIHAPKTAAPSRTGTRKPTALRSSLVAFTALALSALATAAAPCATCHVDKAATQSRSRHALSLRPYDGTGFAGRTLRERGGTAYAYTKDGVSISRDGETRTAAVAWTFGAGHFARTLVLKQDNRWVEHRISDYPGAGRLSLTPGHSPRPADSFDVAFGIVQSDVNATRCFGCHSTGESRPGVHCQRCHGEGENHPREKTIRRTRDVALCADCHRSPNREYASPEPEVEDPASIRFAPVGLTASRCYQASQGKLSCVTCHDPHTDVKPAASFDAACRGCHSAPAKKAAARKPCPRAANCAGCHMPKSSPLPLLTFTDHRIR